MQTSTTFSPDESKLHKKQLLLLIIMVLTKNKAKDIYCNLPSSIFVCLFMQLNVIQAKLTSKQCWSAVSPAILGVARCLYQGHLVTYICSCLLAVLRKVLPPPHARALPGSTNFVATNAQAHLLVMSLMADKKLQIDLQIKYRKYR